MLQAITTKVALLTLLPIAAFIFILYVLVKVSQNQSGQNDGTGTSGCACSSCGTSRDAHSGGESGCGSDSKCSGYCGCCGGD
nr:hypothetical protein [uncultured Emticicia sp.]